MATGRRGRKDLPQALDRCCTRPGTWWCPPYISPPNPPPRDDDLFAGFVEMGDELTVSVKCSAQEIECL
ncbi:hypothetical protein KOW79_001926 [Hemibagrus wyckioides]|uniref:Uncharacterized protein n=1 Tax=Hemibagrus wyckioides TaxID=337641 RepID=A0A9D3SUE3_9TELE|nr:hypothetical protein KOW79_001926 [Hemibagrus wyckioides]